MQAQEIMTGTVECVSPEMSIRDAARKMKSMDVGFLPVGEGDRLVGAITDRDIVLRVVAAGKSITECKVRDVMTNEIFWCYDDQTGAEVAQYMAEKEVRRVVILNRQKRLVGVISIGDLAKHGEEQRVGAAIKDITEAPPQAA